MNKLFNNDIKFSTSTDLLLKLFASLLFLFISYIALIFHEPWRDELQAFSLVRNTNTINELIQLVRYEGHPLGWYILQKIMFQFITNFKAIQLLHWLFLSIGVLLFIWKSPFHILYRVAIVFGYFFIYEYSAIARNYGIAIPFYMLLCILFNKKKHWLFGILILITMQFSLYSFIIALSIAIGYFYLHQHEKNKSYFLGLLFSLVGIILFKIVVNPPTDIGTSPNWNFKPDSYTSAFSVIANALIPIFKFDIHFWNTSVFETIFNYNCTQALQFILSIFLFAWAIKALYKNKLSLLIFLLGFSIMIFFMGAKYHGSIRHHGHIYILFLMTIWIGKNITIEIKYPFSISNKMKRIILFFPEKYITTMFISILIFQIIGSLQAVYYEIKYPFSANQQAANFIQNNYTNAPIIAYVDDACTSVSILMNKKILHANSDLYDEHLVFNNRRNYISFDTLIAKSNRFFSSHPNGILLLSKSNETFNFIPKMPYKLIYHTDEAIRYDESYLIYIQK
jgi:hypothetical protein